MRLRTLAFGLVALSAALGFAGCSAEPKQEVSSGASEASDTVRFTAAQIEHGGVRWSEVKAESMIPTFELTGQLMPDEDHTARLASPVEGRIMSVAVRIGDRVQRGQTLALLQSTAGSAARADLVKAEAELASKRAGLTYARSARERAERLLAAKAGAKQDVDRARADEELAVSSFTAAEAELTRAKAAAEHLGISADSDEVHLRSPLQGVVIGRDAIPGAVVSPGGALVTVTDVSRLWLEVAAPDSAAETLRPGGRVRFSVSALGKEVFEASIESVGGSLDPQTRMLPVRGVVDNRAGRLRPNMFATVLLESGAETQAFGVPDTAVVLVDEKPVVFVATPEPGGGARFERRPVQLGRKDGARTLVTGSVRAGENVVVEGAFAIKSQFERAKMPAEG
jgi:cobalt-zinc-cadmium efflux system membrane fusion protein